MNIGEKAPDFTLTDCCGNEVDSRSLRGKKIWLYFFTSPGGGNWTRMAHGYRELADRFSQHDIVIYGMNDKGAQVNKEWVEKENLPFKVLQDVGRKVGAALEMSDPDGDRYVKKSEEGRRPAVVIDENGFILAWEQDMNTTEAIENLLNRIT